MGGGLREVGVEQVAWLRVMGAGEHVTGRVRSCEGGYVLMLHGRGGH